MLWCFIADFLFQFALTSCDTPVENFAPQGIALVGWQICEKSSVVSSHLILNCILSSFSVTSLFHSKSRILSLFSITYSHLHAYLFSPSLHSSNVILPLPNLISSHLISSHVISSHLISSHSILSNLILPNSSQLPSYLVFHPMPSNLISSNFISSIQLHQISSHLIPSNLIMIFHLHNFIPSSSHFITIPSYLIICHKLCSKTFVYIMLLCSIEIITSQLIKCFIFVWYTNPTSSKISDSKL